MQALLQMHVPVYNKHPSEHVYLLHSFLQVAAVPRSIKMMLGSIKETARAPSVVFVAGDSTTFMCFHDTEQDHAKTGRNITLPYPVSAVHIASHDGEDSDSGYCMMPTHSAVAFFSEGTLHTLPVKDYLVSFPLCIPCCSMRVHMLNIARRQGQVYLRLLKQVQFLNIHADNVLSSEHVSLKDPQANMPSALSQIHLRLHQAPARCNKRKAQEIADS